MRAAVDHRQPFEAAPQSRLFPGSMHVRAALWRLWCSSVHFWAVRFRRRQQGRGIGPVGKAPSNTKSSTLSIREQYFLALGEFIHSFAEVELLLNYVVLDYLGIKR